MRKNILIGITILLLGVILFALISCDSGSCEDWSGKYEVKLSETKDYKDYPGKRVIELKEDMTWEESFTEFENASSGKLDKNGCNFTLKTENENIDSMNASVDEGTLVLKEGREEVTFKKLK